MPTIEELKKEPWLIEDIEVPTTEEMLASVQSEGLCVNFLVLNPNIKNIPLVVQKAAIENYPWSLAYLSNPEQDEDAAEVLDIKTWTEMVSYCLDSEPNMIKLLKSDPEKYPVTKNMQLELVTKDPQLIKHINKPDREIQMIAITHEPGLYETLKSSIDFHEDVQRLAALQGVG